MAKFGTCRLHGGFGKLSFEHVPPRSAGNSRSARVWSLDELLERERRAQEDLARLSGGRIQQQGMGGYYFCGKCNSDTGGWYGGDYLYWAYRGAELLVAARPSLETTLTTTLCYPYRVRPLRVLKQVACMFLAINEGLHDSQPQLARFVLDREARHFPPNLRVFAYLTVGPRMRQIGTMVVGSGFGTGSVDAYLMSEIAFPPFGYVLAFNKEKPPDPRLIEITHFGAYGYQSWAEAWLAFPTLPIASWVAADYRDPATLRRDVARNRAAERGPT